MSKLSKKDRKVEEHTLMLLSLSVKLLMLLRITETTCNFRFHLIVEMMQFILVPSTWDLQWVNQQESYSILDQSTWLSQVYFAMMRLQETTNSKSTIPSLEDLCRETRPIRGVRPWLTICTSQNQTKSCLKLHQSWLMDPLSCRDSYGRITLAFNLWRVKRR